MTADMLRDAILSGELQPGDRLIQDEIAERFNVSPTPVREAIQQLVAEGVLVHSPYRGVQVAEVRLEDVREVYLMRGALEQLAVRIAAPNLRLADVRHLQQLQARMRQHVEALQLDALPPLNREFHILIYERAEMPLLLQMIGSLWLKSPWDSLFVVPHRAEMVIAEHQAVLDAIIAGDADAAGAAMLTHIERGAQSLAHFLDGRQPPR